MRIHGRVVAIAACFGVFLLLYFWGGNAADDPLLKEVGEDSGEDGEEDGESSPSPSEFGGNEAEKFAEKERWGSVHAHRYGHLVFSVDL